VVLVAPPNSDIMSYQKAIQALIEAEYITPPPTPCPEQPPLLPSRMPPVQEEEVYAEPHENDGYHGVSLEDLADTERERQMMGPPRRYSMHGLRRALEAAGKPSAEKQDLYAVLTREEMEEYERHCIDSDMIRLISGSDNSQPTSNGPAFSPLTIPVEEISISQQEAISASAASYLEEVDAWTRDLQRLIAESRAIREAPLSAFADLAALEDDDTIPEVDIDAA